MFDKPTRRGFGGLHAGVWGGRCANRQAPPAVPQENTFEKSTPQRPTCPLWRAFLRSRGRLVYKLLQIRHNKREEEATGKEYRMGQRRDFGGLWGLAAAAGVQPRDDREVYRGAGALFCRERGAGGPRQGGCRRMAGQPGGTGVYPATVNAMLAAVNDYQESIGNAAGQGEAAQAAAAGVLRRGPRADPRRILPPAGRRAGQRATPARCCCWRPSAPPASACRSLCISRRRPCSAAAPASGARANAGRSCCPRSCAAACKNGAGSAASTPGRCFCPARGGR